MPISPTSFRTGPDERGHFGLFGGRSVPLPWFLAGGLTPDNVAEAVKVTGARAVDLSSGVESSRGVKSIDLIRAFLDRVKAL